MDEKRLFSEKEAAELVQRAVELQENDSEGGLSYTPGVTWQELQNIAREAGLDPRYLQKALEAPDEPEKKPGFLGFTQEQVSIHDGEIDPEDFDLIFEDVKPTTGQNAMMSQLGRRAAMNTMTGLAQTNVEVTSRRGRTRLKVRSNSLVAFFITLYPSLIGGIIGMAASFENKLWLLGLVIIAAALGLGWFLFRLFVKKGHKSAEELADKLRGRIEREIEMDKKREGTSVETDEDLTQRLNA